MEKGREVGVWLAGVEAQWLLFSRFYSGFAKSALTLDVLYFYSGFQPEAAKPVKAGKPAP